MKASTRSVAPSACMNLLRSLGVLGAALLMGAGCTVVHVGKDATLNFKPAQVLTDQAMGGDVLTEDSGADINLDASVPIGVAP